MAQSIKLMELPERKITDEVIDQCFHVEFDEIGQPLYRVSIKGYVNSLQQQNEDLKEALEYVKESINVSYQNHEPIDESALFVIEEALKKIKS